MEGIYNMNHLRIKDRGTVLIIAFITMGVLMLLGVYFLSFTLTESRIAKSQTVGTQAYYLAEAGINEAIWKLKYDDKDVAEDGDEPWAICFASSTDPCPACDATWTASSIINLTPNSTTTTTIIRSECARGEITATSTIGLAKGKTAQRVVKTKVIKALGSLTEDSPLFVGHPSGDIIIKDSIMNVYNGNIFGNNVLNIQKGGTVNVYDNPATDIQEGKVLVAGNCDEEKINASSTCCANVCDTTSTCECDPDPEDLFEECEEDGCPINRIDMPPVVFSSYYNKAEQAELHGQCRVLGKDSGGATVVTNNQCVFTREEFEAFLEDIGVGGTLILEHRANEFATSTYYIEGGGFTLGWWKHLEIHGVLVADQSVYIGKHTSAYLTIYDPGPGIPSGLLTQKKMDFGEWFLLFQEVEVEGLLYSKEEISIVSIPHAFTVKGGIIARKLDLDSGLSDNPLNIYLDNDRIREGIWGGPQPPPGEPIEYSPIITIEHWEEEY